MLSGLYPAPVSMPKIICILKIHQTVFKKSTNVFIKQDAEFLMLGSLSFIRKSSRFIKILNSEHFSETITDTKQIVE